MKRLVVVLGILCFASSALALPMPFSFPPPSWSGGFLGFQVSGGMATRDGIRDQCADGNGFWGNPRDRRRQAAGMRACTRTVLDSQVVTTFAFDENGLVLGAFALTVGDRDLFEGWERQSRLEMGSPRSTRRNRRVWSAFDANRRPWYRLLIFFPESNQVSYIHIQGRLPSRL